MLFYLLHVFIVWIGLVADGMIPSAGTVWGFLAVFVCGYSFIAGPDIKALYAFFACSL